MSAQLVIAELTAFRAVLSKAQRNEGDAIRAWGRSTITNALHRVGPVPALNDAAQQALGEVAALAHCLETAASPDAALEQARGRAVKALDHLIETVRRLKAQGSGPSSG